MPHPDPNFPFLAAAHALRSGQIDPVQYIFDLCDRLDALDPQIHASLPEGGRRVRLLNDAVDLKRRYPDPATRPPLFGIPVGVKGIVSAEGFPTQAGMPAITFPAAVAANGPPFGLQLVARYNMDEYLPAWAEPMEAVLRSYS